MSGENSCNVFMLLIMILGVLISAILCKRAVFMMWHAFLLHGLRLVGLFPPFSFLLGGFHFFSLM
jgi:hypothetical protein